MEIVATENVWAVGVAFSKVTTDFSALSICSMLLAWVGVTMRYYNITSGRPTIVKHSFAQALQ